MPCVANVQPTGYGREPIAVKPGGRCPHKALRPPPPSRGGRSPGARPGGKRDRSRRSPSAAVTSPRGSLFPRRRRRGMNTTPALLTRSNPCVAPGTSLSPRSGRTSTYGRTGPEPACAFTPTSSMRNGNNGTRSWARCPAEPTPSAPMQSSARRAPLTDLECRIEPGARCNERNRDQHDWPCAARAGEPARMRTATPKGGRRVHSRASGIGYRSRNSRALVRSLPTRPTTK